MPVPAVTALLLLACGSPPEKPASDGSPSEAPPPASAETPPSREAPGARGPEGISWPPRQAAPVPTGKMKHAVVIVVDTLRDDALKRAETPNIDRLVATGGQRVSAWAPSTWTAPSIISMFTGMHVREHGWDFPFPSRMDHRTDSYPGVPDVPVLAEVMQAQGFNTVGLYANQLLGRELGYGRGFDAWHFGSDVSVSMLAAEAIESWEQDERHFLYVHLFGAHHPLSPRPISRDRYGLTRKDLGRSGQLGLPKVRQGEIEESVYWRAYHAVVEDTDRRIGRILSALRPHMDETVVIITSDHGELLGEAERFGHGSGLWEQLTAVPFVATNAPPLPERVGVAGVPALVTAATGVEAAWQVAYDAPPPLVSGREGATALTLDGRHKAAWGLADFPGPVAWDLAEDPHEEQPLDEVPADLAAAWEQFQQEVPYNRLRPVEAGMNDEMVSALEALGYMEE